MNSKSTPIPTMEQLKRFIKNGKLTESEAVVRLTSLSLSITSDVTRKSVPKKRYVPNLNVARNYRKTIIKHNNEKKTEDTIVKADSNNLLEIDDEKMKAKTNKFSEIQDEKLKVENLLSSDLISLVTLPEVFVKSDVERIGTICVRRSGKIETVINGAKCFVDKGFDTNVMEDVIVFGQDDVVEIGTVGSRLTVCPDWKVLIAEDKAQMFI